MYYNDDPENDNDIFLGSYMWNLDKSSSMLGFEVDLYDDDGELIGNGAESCFSYEGSANASDTAGCFYKLEESIKTSDIKNLSVVERLYEGTDHSQIWKWLDYADEDMGWEGIMINLDTPYECKRTKNLIKVKRFFEKDLRCTKVNIATTGKYKGIMGSITCNYFDNTVDVGSGFNDSQREHFVKHPEEIVGKIVSVKYKEETQNKDGGKSLQFPVYMGILIDRDKAVDE